MEQKNHTYLGVDVAKATLRVQTPKQNYEVANTVKGIDRIIKDCAKVESPLVVFEATGSYEQLLMEQLHQHGVACKMVSPDRVRAFIRSEGVRAKNDPIDARMLVRFAAEKRLQAMDVQPRACRQLRALSDRRGQLVDMRAREKVRLQNSPKVVLADIQSMIRIFDKRIAKIEKQIAQLIEDDPDLNARNKVITNIVGVGLVTSSAIMAYMPELPSISRNAASSLAGLAPFDKDSGTKFGKRRIYGGRSKVRTSLYMATVSASIHNDVIKAYIARLRAANKPAKCAIVAGMRKLLLHIRSELIRFEKGTWIPHNGDSSKDFTEPLTELHLVNA